MMGGLFWEIKHVVNYVAHGFREIRGSVIGQWFSVSLSFCINKLRKWRVEKELRECHEFTWVG